MLHQFFQFTFYLAQTNKVKLVFILQIFTLPQIPGRN